MSKVSMRSPAANRPSATTVAATGTSQTRRSARRSSTGIAVTRTRTAMNIGPLTKASPRKKRMSTSGTNNAMAGTATALRARYRHVGSSLPQRIAAAKSRQPTSGVQVNR